MTQEELLEGNKICAEFLKLPEREDCYNITQLNYPTGVWRRNINLEFHSDSNWQWLVLEKLLEESNTLTDMISLLNRLASCYNTNLNDKQDLFEAIVKYIKENGRN